MHIRFLQRLGEMLLLVAFFFLINLESLVFWYLFLDIPAVRGTAIWLEAVLWGPVVILMLGLLWKTRQFTDYALLWKRQPLLLVFVSLCFLSAFWSLSWMATLYRAFALFFATVIAVYLALRYPLPALIRVLFWFSVVAVLGSYLLAILDPQLGTDMNRPYEGAWRGLFWHKNHLGVLASFFSLVFLVEALARDHSTSGFIRRLALVFYFLSLALVYLAASATGYILVLVLHFAIGLALLWQKTRHALRPIHYYSFLAVMTIGATLVLTNLEFVFHLLNRSPTLTGRVPLWNHLLMDWIRQRPWLGYGFGSVWSLDWFRVGLQDLLGWGYPVRISDNGFLDVLLYLGSIGLLLFLVIYGLAWVRAAKLALARPALINFFPLLFLGFSLIANISFSLLLETELLVWTLIVVFSVFSAPAGKK